ncbi:MULTISPECIES: hypothetical protein [Empedobacter]|uniref:Uncharacterized protein n=1 Tax=Empedobacter falsenii TaxID=343874 RepID=A0A7H9DQZ1_9FLAO|nr:MULTISPECIES: hypothetical protein [Empedobacter]MDH2206782.1 hypothetical protein [Empedobacter sp. GD03644]QLL57460.1 hypothetical protein FH779_04910 [Empedobacter falsenii]
MQTKNKLSELTLDELQTKHKKVNKLTITIQVILLVISISLILGVFANYLKPINVVFVSLSVIFIPFITGLNQINQELKNRNN